MIILLILMKIMVICINVCEINIMIMKILM